MSFFTLAEMQQGMCRPKSSEFIYHIDTDDEVACEGYTHAWVGYRSDWEMSKTHTASDKLRTRHMLAVYPEFKGVDDMAGHFEFDMPEQDVKAHFADLGIPNIADITHPSDEGTP